MRNTDDTPATGQGSPRGTGQRGTDQRGHNKNSSLSPSPPTLPSPPRPAQDREREGKAKGGISLWGRFAAGMAMPGPPPQKSLAPAGLELCPCRIGGGKVYFRQG
ncbi:hypothetical protein CDD83_3795 [Cordyceps sp. RAO-2017]|nr:hypothetical protein CDD83_3795 [Cordyceps sp. RAO-2017]